VNAPFPRSSTVILALAASLFGGRPPSRAAEAELTIAKSIEVLNEIAVNPRTGPPRPILLKAEGIAIIPDQLAGGFVIGAKFGKGIVLVRRPDGGWSNPVFINSFGGSFGLQAGAQATDLVLVFKGRRSVESFLNGKGKLTMGLDASAAAGPIGRNFEAGTDLAFKAEILSYSRSRGIFAGVSAAGGTLSVDRKANAQYYGLPIGSIEIFADNTTLRPPPSAAILQRILAGMTGVPVVRKSRTRIKPAGPIGDEPVIEIEGDEDLPAEAAPRTSSRRRAAPQSQQSTTAKRKAPPTDDDVMLATGDADEPDTQLVRKTRSTSWKKSKAGTPRAQPIAPTRPPRPDDE
jgi:lipid-binding SYLF domain-containing protein